MTELEALKARHSVRVYKERSIEPYLCDLIDDKIAELNNAHGLHIQLVTEPGSVFHGIVSRLCGWSHVPAYIAMIGKDSESLDELCGYVGEQLVLYAQMMGLNTCWAGIYKRKQVTAQISEGERLSIVIAIGYGETEGKPHRSKNYADVVDAVDPPSWFKNGVDAALLAPTAMNQQKFVFSLDDGVPTSHISSGGPFTKVDLGIANYNFEVASGRKIANR